MPYVSPSLTTIVNSVKKAANPLGRDFNELEHLQNSVHGGDMFAMRSYERVRNILREELAKFKPNYAFVCEKNDAIPPHGNYFMINAIDGYNNFAHGNANFAISVAMIENNTIVSGVVYNPIRDEMFFAEKGSGAFKEGFRSHERIRIAGGKDVARALIGCGSDADFIGKAFALSSNVTISGTAALDLAYVAAGKLDIALLTNAEATALAAGILLVKEAGGYIFAIGQTDTRSENLRQALFGGNIFACNEAMRQKIAEIVAK